MSYRRRSVILSNYYKRRSVKVAVACLVGRRVRSVSYAQLRHIRCSNRVSYVGCVAYVALHGMNYVQSSLPVEHNTTFDAKTACLHATLMSPPCYSTQQHLTHAPRPFAFSLAIDRGTTGVSKGGGQAPPHFFD